jgi:hypothetical protein
VWFAEPSAYGTAAESEEKNMPKTVTANITNVVETLAKTAVHTLNVYGDNDPAGCDILYGLTRLAGMMQDVYEPDESLLDGFHKAIEDTKASQAPVEVLPVTDNDLRHAQTVLNYFIEKLPPDEPDLDKMKAAVEYLTDFYAASSGVN